MSLSFNRSIRDRQPPSTSTGIRAPARRAIFPAFPAETAIATRSSIPADSASHPVRFQRSVHCLFVDFQLSIQLVIVFSTVEAKVFLNIGSKTALAAHIAEVSPLETTDRPLI